MSLTATQHELFLSVRDPLLVYANERLEIVENLDATCSDDDRNLRLELVSRALWQHPELIDAYVRENPHALTGQQLKIVQDLRFVLYDDFVYEGMQEGRAIFIHDTGTYLVDSFELSDIEQHAKLHTIIRTALAPFMGDIVLVDPCCPIGIADDQLETEIHKAARRRGATTPTAAGSDLTRRARSWQQHKRRKRHEINAPAAPAGPGYHRGVLAGLSEEERRRAWLEHYDHVVSESGIQQQLMELHALEVDHFPTTLAEALDLLDDDWLESIADEMTELDEDNMPARDELITLICQQVTRDKDRRDMTLVWCIDTQFDLVRSLTEHNPLPLSDRKPSESVGLYALIPYLFILHQGDRFDAWMPPELLPLMRATDFEALEHARTLLNRVVNAAGALASSCGIIDLDSAYEQYRAVEDRPLSRESFEKALVEMEVCDRRDSYTLWDHDGTSYLLSSSLSDQAALARVVRTRYASHVRRVDSAPEIGVLSVDEALEGEMIQLLEQERSHFLSIRLKLLDAHQRQPPRALVPAMLDRPFVDYLMDLEQVRRVRDYVDEHLPDSEDDYEFPDTFSRAVIISMLFEQETYDDVLDLIRLFGMQDCEGSRYPNALGRMITDVYNVLPEWTLNGHSLAENTERLTGKPFAMQACA